MIIRQVSLDIVCGVTSRLPDTGKPEIALCRKIQCRQIIADQQPGEPEGSGPYQLAARKDQNH